MRCLIIFALMFGLAGCITLSDVSTGAGATAGAVIGSASGIGTVGTAVLTVTGATAGAIAVDEPAPAIDAETVAAIQNPWQAAAVAFSDLLSHAFEIVIAIGIAVIGLPMLLSFAVGKVMPNRKTKEIEAENKTLKKLMEK